MMILEAEEVHILDERERAAVDLVNRVLALLERKPMGMAHDPDPAMQRKLVVVERIA